MYKLSFIVVVFSIIHCLKLTAQTHNIKFNSITTENGLSNSTVFAITKDKYGFMWFATMDGLCRFDGYKIQIYRNNPNDPHTLNSNRARSLYCDKTGTLWIASVNSMPISRYNYESDNFDQIPRKNLKKDILDSLATTKKSLTFATYKNYYFYWTSYTAYLHQINLKNRQHIILRKNPLDPFSLNDDYVTNVYIADGILWVGTSDGGVNYANLNAKPFDHIHYIYHEKNSLVENSTRAIIEDFKGNLWIGSRSKGITIINRDKNSYKTIKAPNTELNNTRKIYQDRFGFIWVGTKGGLEKYDDKGSLLKVYTANSKNPIPHNWVYAIMEDHAGCLWIGTWNGIAKYDRTKDCFWAYDPQKTISYPIVRDIIEDHLNNLWVATQYGGITCLKHDSFQGGKERIIPVKHYEHSPQKTNTISSNLVFSLLEDKHGIIWAGTSNGLNRIDPQSGKIKHFTEKDGVTSEMVNGILSDLKGNIWFSQITKGISKLNTNTFKVTNFTKLDGLQSDEFSEGSFFRSTKTGEMFFGGINGINTFHPDSIKPNLSIPPVYFTNLMITNNPVFVNKPFNERIILQKPLYLTKQLKIKYSEKSFSIEFTALDYSNAKQNKFLYKLEGFDKEWIPSDAANRMAKYSNLPPGDYILKVKGSNGDGIWNPKPIEMQIEILPQWWQTWLFRIIVILFLTFTLIASLHYKIVSYKKRQIELKKMVWQRTKELEISNQTLTEKNIHVEEQAKELQINNEKLLESQARILEQAEELKSQTESLKKINDLLIENQKQIQSQSDKLQSINIELSLQMSTKDRLLSIIAHDLRNPFNVVSGFAEVLQRDLNHLPEAKVRRFLSLIQASSTGANNLLENLLQWTRAQTGRISYHPERLNLRSIVQDIELLSEGFATRKNINLKIDIDDSLKVWADDNMLRTILRNLLSNAIKFSFENGEVTISAQNHINETEITVSDKGTGISAENQKCLFHLDTNISTQGTMKEKGSGLGLIICNEFVEKHKGKIWVISEFGKGSQFKFTLPFHAK